MGWLTTVARNRGIDTLRRAARTLGDSAAVLDRLEAAPPPGAPPPLEGTPDDDRLRLIFVCCHPALHPRAQGALALRTLCKQEPTQQRAGSGSQKHSYFGAST